MLSPSYLQETQQRSKPHKHRYLIVEDPSVTRSFELSVVEEMEIRKVQGYTDLLRLHDLLVLRAPEEM